MLNNIAVIQCYNDLRGQTLHYAFGNNGFLTKAVSNKGPEIMSSLVENLGNLVFESTITRAESFNTIYESRAQKKAPE